MCSQKITEFGLGAALAGSCEELRLFAKQPVQEANDFGGFPCREPVEYHLAVTPGFHETVLAQPRKHLAGRCLAHTNMLHELTDRFLSGAEMTQDHQALLMRESFEEAGGLCSAA